MIDQGLQEFDKWFRIVLTSIWGAVLVYYMAPQYHSFLGVCRAIITAIIVSSGMFLWWMDGAPITEYQELIVIVVAASLADSFVVGGLKVMVMFREDPFKVIQKFRGKK